MCIENSAGHRNKFCGVELTSTDLLKQCIQAQASHPLLELEWSVVGPNVDELDENTLNQIGARKHKLVLDGPEFSNTNETKNYDYLLLEKILSRKKDPVQYLQRCKELLRDDGFAIVNEVTKSHEIALIVHALQGYDIDMGDSERIYGAYFKVCNMF